MKGVTMAPDVDTETIARGTPGFSGADLANLVNHAAIKASKENSRYVTNEDLEWAKDKIMMGSERKSAVISPESKKLTAYHEGGHALVSLYTPGSMPLHKVTVIPRGQALGVTVQLPEGDQTSVTKKELLAKLDVCMGGRVAEEIIFGEENVTTGASSDLQSATRIAQSMVMSYGMSEEFGLATLHSSTYDKASSQSRAVVESETKRILNVFKTNSNFRNYFTYKEE
jgi:ATP-dependent metalloprotease